MRDPAGDAWCDPCREPAREGLDAVRDPAGDAWWELWMMVWRAWAQPTSPAVAAGMVCWIETESSPAGDNEAQRSEKMPRQRGGLLGEKWQEELEAGGDRMVRRHEL